MSIYSKDAAINNGDLIQTEIHLYGSSRLGVYNLKNNVEHPDLNIGKVLTFTRGEKFFELSNHLGNVLATVSDKKLQYSSDNATIDYFYADVVSAHDYYPFGMLMPGRKYSVANTNYRYGFNGNELDKEVARTTTYDYGFRIYNPGLGRFLSVDPLAKKYPQLTPFQYASNSPISGIDEDGLEWAYYDKDNKQVDIDNSTTNEDKLKIVGARWTGYDIDKDGNRTPKPGTVSTAFTFGAKGMTIGLTSKQGTPLQSWFSYENMGSGNKATDKKISTLHPLVRNQMKAFILESYYRFGIDLRVTDAFRTESQQDRLFAQGRSQEQIEAKKKNLGITREIEANPSANIVTKAIGGYSNHNFGLAVDVVPFENGKLNWNTKFYPLIGLIGEKRGLEWGHRWKTIDDKPHFQNLQGKTLKELRALSKDDNGLPIIE